MSEDPFFASREWLDVRYAVLKASKGCCQLCGERASESNPLQVDHIKPRSKFPALALAISNLQVLCRRCNLGKGAKDATDWRFMPTQAMRVLEECPPEIRAKLQQLGWLRINGGDKQMRKEAHREYQKVWHEALAAWRERESTK